MSRALAQAGVSFEKNNPVATLFTDMTTGDIRKDILNEERFCPPFLEIAVPVARVEDVIRIVKDVEKRMDTVVVLGVAVRCDENGDDKVVAPILERLGYKPARAKSQFGSRPCETSGMDVGGWARADARQPKR